MLALDPTLHRTKFEFITTSPGQGKDWRRIRNHISQDVQRRKKLRSALFLDRARSSACKPLPFIRRHPPQRQASCQASHHRTVDTDDFFLPHLLASTPHHSVPPYQPDHVSAQTDDSCPTWPCFSTPIDDICLNPTTTTTTPAIHETDRHTTPKESTWDSRICDWSSEPILSPWPTLDVELSSLNEGRGSAIPWITKEFPNLDFAAQILEAQHPTTSSPSWSGIVSLPSILGGNPDPFDCFLAPTYSKHLLEIHLFMCSKLQNARTNGESLYPMTTTVPILLNDVAGSHALFSHSSFARYVRTGKRPGWEAIYHKLSAIRLINERIRSGDEISDATILSVIVLWNLEAHFGEISQVQVHVDGLRNMIASRGGLSSLCGPVLFALAWTATCNAGTLALLPSRQLPVQNSRLSPNAYLSDVATEVLVTLAQIQRLAISSSSAYHIYARSYKARAILRPYMTTSCNTQFQYIKFRASRDPSLQASSCRLAILFFIHTIFLDEDQNISSPQDTDILLAKMDAKLLAGNLHKSGSVEKVWQTLMVGAAGSQDQIHDSTASIAFDGRVWRVVRLMSLAKLFSIELMEQISKLLWYNLGGLEDEGLDNGMSQIIYEHVMRQFQQGSREVIERTGRCGNDMDRRG